MLSLYLLFEGNVVIVGEGILVGAFVVIAVNTMMMAHFGVMVSALADECVDVCGIDSCMLSAMVRWYLTGRCSSLGMVWTKMR